MHLILSNKIRAKSTYKGNTKFKFWNSISPGDILVFLIEMKSPGRGVPLVHITNETKTLSCEFPMGDADKYLLQIEYDVVTGEKIPFRDLQYTITEENDWEGETWRYIVRLAPEDYKILKKLIDQQEEARYSIEKTAYTWSTVEQLNKLATTDYMDAIGFYSFKVGRPYFDTQERVNSVFYKAGGLTRIEYEQF